MLWSANWVDWLVFLCDISDVDVVASAKTKLQLKVEKKLPKLEEVNAASSSSQQSAKETPKVTSATSFTMKEKFRCSPVDLFECLVEPNRVRAYAGGDAQVSREVGGKFKLFGGSVEGENLEVVKLFSDHCAYSGLSFVTPKHVFWGIQYKFWTLGTFSCVVWYLYCYSHNWNSFSICILYLTNYLYLQWWIGFFFLNTRIVCIAILLTHPQVPPKKLVQKWRFNTWPEGYYSTVTIQLEEKDGKTILSLEQVLTQHFSHFTYLFACLLL